MAHTVAKLAKLSGVSVRTLHWYDEVGLLKPAYLGSNGYRYYEEEQLLTLQQILFFRELGFELKQIQKILERSDFDKMVALSSHRQVLQKSLERTKKLIVTIDKTINHLKGNKKMNENEMYSGFNKLKQAEYEKLIIERFGEKGKNITKESRQNVANWSKSDWASSQKEFDSICKELTHLIKKESKVSSNDVQTIIKRHYNWLMKFWKPNKESYIEHSRFIVESELRKPYEAYHSKLPEFLAKAIHIYANNQLT